MAGGVIERYLKATTGVYAEIVDVLELSNDAYQYLYGKTYFKLVDAVPRLVGWGYDQNDPPFTLKKPVAMFDRINPMKTVRRIKDFNPDVVVCTHFLPARLAALLLVREMIDAPIFADLAARSSTLSTSGASGSSGWGGRPRSSSLRDIRTGPPHLSWCRRSRSVRAYRRHSGTAHSVAS